MKILFIQTGWSIDKDYPRWAWSYSFEISTPAFERILEKVNPSFEYDTLSVLKKDSLDINDEDRELIYKACLESNCDKIIITHWTDTMIKTATKLSTISNKTIIILWSFRPEVLKDTDADFNLGVAVWAINVLTSWVFIAMNWGIFSLDKIKKDLVSWKFSN